MTKKDRRKSFTVLVVDDEDEFREMTIKRLLRRELQAEGAENGVMALKMIEQGHFDVVLLDVKIDELLEKLRDAYEKRYHQLEKIEQAQIKRHMAMPS